MIPRVYHVPDLPDFAQVAPQPSISIQTLVLILVQMEPIQTRLTWFVKIVIIIVHNALDSPIHSVNSAIKIP